MKKFYLLAGSLFFSASVFSQALPNNSFDNWNQMTGYEDPANWNTLNPSTVILGVITCEKATGADVHSGAAAIKLTTLSVLGQNANGLATTGTIDVVGMTVTGGLPYTLRPDSITGWYKCNPISPDYGFVDFTLFDASGTDTVGFAHFQTPSSPIITYTYFSVPINYYNSNTPAIARCVMSSSQGLFSVVGSVMIADDLGLVFNTSGIREPLFGKNTVHYASASQSLDVFAFQPTHVTVIDMTGKKIFETEVEKGHTRHALPGLEPGLYLYLLGGDEKGQAVSGKFIAE